MRIVRIVKQSVKYNPHIHNVGEIAHVDEEGHDWLQVSTLSGGHGAVDKGAVEDVDIETLPPDQRYELKHMAQS